MIGEMGGSMFPTLSADNKVWGLESELRRATGGQVRKVRRKLEAARAEQAEVHKRVAEERRRGMHQW